ncbi:MAG: DNA internalization-related competence protein ComEC/Rec2 [Pseudomonadota bacterium]
MVSMKSPSSFSMKSLVRSIKYRPLMLISVCLLLGLVSSQFILFLFFIILVFVLSTLDSRFRGNDKKRNFIFLLLAFLICGYLLGKVSMRQPPALAEYIAASKQAPVICQAKVLTDPDFKNKIWQMDLRLIQCQKNPKSSFEPVPAKVRFYSWELLENYRAGDVIKFQGRLKNPRQYKNPGSFNYPLYLQSQGIQGLATPTKAQWIVKLQNSSSLFYLPSLKNARAKIEKTILKNTSESASGILSALAIGQKQYLGPKMRQLFSRTGVAHLLAISGLHVGFIALLVFWLTRITLGWWPRLLNWLPLPYLASLFSLPAIWLYVALAGYPVSAVRAAIMLTVFILAFVSLRYKYDLLTALAAAIFVIILVSPAAIFSLSFQFSVLAVFGLIIFFPLIWQNFEKYFSEASSWWKNIIKRITQLLIVTVTATLVTAPLSGYYFQQITGIGIIANIVAVPLVGVIILPIAMFGAVFTLIYEPIGAFGFKLAGSVCAALLDFLQLLDAKLDFLVISWAPNKWEVVLALTVISAVLMFRYLPYKKIILSVIGFLIILDFSFWYILPYFQNKLKINFIDVGQGDCMLVQFPNQKKMLIDGGGIKGSEFDIGEKVVVPVLLNLGVRHLDYILLTHPHHDHYGGLGAVAQKLGAPVLYYNGLAAPEDEQDQWADFLTKALQSQVQLKQLDGHADFQPALILNEGGVQILVYAPRPKDLSALDLNDTSLVTQLKFGEQKILLTGDLEATGEQILTEKGVNLKSQVLKLGHHGSKTSTTSEFLEKVSPEIAVITVGQGNKYGFPNEVVLDRLQERRIKIYRTDLEGMITVKTNGHNLDVSTYVEPF